MEASSAAYALTSSAGRITGFILKTFWSIPAAEKAAGDYGASLGRLRLPSRRLGDHRGSAVASTAGQSLILRLKLNIRLVRVAEELGDQLLHEVVETHLLLSEGKYPSRCIC